MLGEQRVEVDLPGRHVVGQHQLQERAQVRVSPEELNRPRCSRRVDLQCVDIDVVDGVARLPVDPLSGVKRRMGYKSPKAVREKGFWEGSPGDSTGHRQRRMQHSVRYHRTSHALPWSCPSLRRSPSLRLECRGQGMGRSPTSR